MKRKHIFKVSYGISQQYAKILVRINKYKSIITKHTGITPSIFHISMCGNDLYYSVLYNNSIKLKNYYCCPSISIYQWLYICSCLLLKIYWCYLSRSFCQQLSIFSCMLFVSITLPITPPTRVVDVKVRFKVKSNFFLSLGFTMICGP